MERGLDKLKIYRALEEYKDRKMPLADELSKIDGLASFVDKLDHQQVLGKHPMLSVVQTPEGLTPVRIDLYWKPSDEYLAVDWDVSYPYTQPWLYR